MKKIQILLVFGLILLSFGCQTIKLEPANYEWPIENAVQVQKDFTISIPRYSLTMNLKKIFENEILITDNQPNVQEVRVIRNYEGLYFLTANKFKNVYILQEDLNKMEVYSIIEITKNGIVNPVFNQRGSYVELLIDNEKIVKLSKEGKYEKK